MSIPPIARAAAKVLAEESVELTTPGAQRQRAVGAIRSEIAATARRRRRNRLAMLFAAAAAAVVVAGAGWRIATHQSPPPHESVARAAPAGSEIAAPGLVAEDVQGSVFVGSASGRTSLDARAPLANGQSVFTGDGGGATIAYRSGSRVRLDAATEAALSEADGTQRVVLTAGAVTAMVAKMGPGERFLVHTDDVDVEAHGTVFRVARREEQGSCVRTFVRVVEGRISVRDAQGERFLAADQDWSSPCKSTRPAVEVASSTPATSSPVAQQRPSTPAAVPPPPTASDLTAQNEMYQRAMNAKSRGDAPGAVRELSGLLKQYPQAPLREAASVQRMTLSDGFDRDAAKGYAKAYLAEYPHGFARADAEHILAE